MTTIYACSIPPEINSPPKIGALPPEMVSDKKVITNKVNTLSKGFKRPSVSEVKAYCDEMGYSIDPETFVNYYNSNGWKVGRSSMKCWKSATTNWQKRENQNGQNRQNGRGNSRGVETRRASDYLIEGDDVFG